MATHDTFARTDPTRAALAPEQRYDDVGKLLLRLALGLLVLLHGVAKLSSGPAAILGMVARAGLPEAFGYLVFVGEVVAPILVVLGIFTRPAAAVIAVNMVFAVLLAHRAELFTLGKTGGWALELQGLFLFMALAVSFLGAGRLSVGGPRGRFN
jgi:putative oxidoreductase